MSVSLKPHASHKCVINEPAFGVACGFTLIELLVVISIVSLLISILLPALASARKATQRVTCINQIRQWTLAMSVYSQDNRGYFPSQKLGVSESTWYSCDEFGLYIGIQNELGRKKLFSCPSWHGKKFSNDTTTSYCLWYPEAQGGVTYSPRVDSVVHASKMALLFDGHAQNSAAAYTWLAKGSSAWTWKISWQNTIRGTIRDTAYSQNTWADGYRHTHQTAGMAFWDLHAGLITDDELSTEPTYSAPLRAK